MPIPVDQLKAAQAPLRDRISAFLREHPDQAYSVVELYVALEGYDEQTGRVMFSMLDARRKQLALEPLRAALAQLQGEEAIISAQQQGTIYYALSTGNR